MTQLKPKVFITRKLPKKIETRMMELFDTTLNENDILLSEEQLDKEVQILHVLNEYYHTPINGVFYSTEEDDYNTILDAGHPYLQI